MSNAVKLVEIRQRSKSNSNFVTSLIASCKQCCGMSCDNAADSSTEWEIDDDLDCDGYSEGNICNTVDEELLDDDVLELYLPFWSEEEVM